MESKGVLFIVKKRRLNDKYSYGSTGLLNSASFVNDMLIENKICSHIVEADDNNDIDREVTKYKPKVCIIEALWVVPEKFEILHRLHPEVKWIIRLHSNLPFLANEGVAMQWLFEYSKSHNNIHIAVNSKKLLDAFNNPYKLFGDILYLPNYYKVNRYIKKEKKEFTNIINIGCFGAIRPMKNILTQAIAAVQFAKENKLILNFHINASRVEQKGEDVLKNLRALFEHLPYNLIEHGWKTHDEFIYYIKHHIDLGMQVSMSETYNIVAADFINSDIPVVVSKEIEFVNCVSKCNPTDVDAITSALLYNYVNPVRVTKTNKRLLKRNSEASEKVWLKFIKEKVK